MYFLFLIIWDGGWSPRDTERTVQNGVRCFNPIFTHDPLEVTGTHVKALVYTQMVPSITLKRFKKSEILAMGHLLNS